jgi:hypothetical protein
MYIMRAIRFSLKMIKKYNFYAERERADFQNGIFKNPFYKFLIITKHHNIYKYV